MIKSRYILLPAVIFMAGVAAQGCSGGSSGGGVAPVGSGTNAPSPSGTITTINQLGMTGFENRFPAPWADPLYDLPRAGYANVASGTICAHPDNGWNPWGTAFQSTDTDVNGDLMNGAAYFHLLELYYRTSPSSGRITAFSQDFLVDQNVSGARWAHPNNVWFGQQVTGNTNIFPVVQPFGALLHTGEHPDNAYHIWQNPVSNTPFKRITIPTTAVIIGIRARFYVIGGALVHIGLDRTPTESSTNASTFAQEIISQSYDDGGFGSARLVDISIESPVTWVDQADPNPTTPNPHPSTVTPITNNVIGPP